MMSDYLIAVAVVAAILGVMFLLSRDNGNRLNEGELHASNERCRREYNRMRLHHPEKIADTIDGYVPAKMQEPGWWDTRPDDLSVKWPDE